MKWIKHLLRCIRELHRTWTYAHADAHVLVIGDSHIRVFEHWWFLRAFPRTHFEIVYVPGATAMGLGNPKSQTRSFRIFEEALATHTSDLVIVHLGEVDTAYTLWKKVERDGGDIEKPLAKAIENYSVFLRTVAQRHALLVLSACLPTLDDQATGDDQVAAMRESVQTSRRVRTDLARQFNKRIAANCAEQNIDFLDMDADVLNDEGLLDAKWINLAWPDHHYARKPFARLLAAHLAARKKRSGIVLR